MPTDEQLKKREAAKEVIDLLEEVAILLVSKLDFALSCNERERRSINSTRIILHLSLLC